MMMMMMMLMVVIMMKIIMMMMMMMMMMLMVVIMMKIIMMMMKIMMMMMMMMMMLMMMLMMTITLRRMMERMIASMLRKMSRGVHDVDHGGVKGAVYRYKAADQEQATLAPHALREPAQSKYIWTSHKSSFMRTLAGKKRTRNTHGHVSRAIVRGKLTGKRPQTKSLPNSPGRLCASLRNQNTYGHVTKAIFDLLYDTSKKKGQEPRGQRLVWIELAAHFCSSKCTNGSKRWIQALLIASMPTWAGRHFSFSAKTFWAKRAMYGMLSRCPWSFAAPSCTRIIKNPHSGTGAPSQRCNFMLTYLKGKPNLNPYALRNVCMWIWPWNSIRPWKLSLLNLAMPWWNCCSFPAGIWLL